MYLCQLEMTRFYKRVELLFFFNDVIVSNLMPSLAQRNACTSLIHQFALQL